MFIIDITYKVELEVVDQYLPAHVDYLKKQYANHFFLLSGKKVPRTGGIILSHLKDKNRLLAILKDDPFYAHDLADYRITEFLPSMSTAELATFKG
ncbi:MAG: YciI family protein [Bacteroidota bacterium]